MPPEDLKSLLFVLTFATDNGWCQPSVQELAEAMRMSEGKARHGLNRLTQRQWRGMPLVTEIRRGSGMDAYAPSPSVLGVRQEEEPLESGTTVSQPIPAPTASREAVIAHSRSAYGRPRALVEEEIAQQMGWSRAEEGEGEEAVVRRRLLALGVSRDQAGELLARHSVGEIRDQLDWLPHRHAKSPARFVVAAIEGRYEPPAFIRLQQAVAKEADQSAEVR